MFLRKSKEVGVAGDEVRDNGGQFMQGSVGHSEDFGFDSKIESLEGFQAKKDAIQLIF